MSEAGPPLRDSYDEADIGALTSGGRFLAAVDAYGCGFFRLSQMLQLAFDRPPYIPRNLDPLVFADLVLELVRRLHAGELAIPDDVKRTYRQSYKPLPPEPGSID